MKRVTVVRCPKCGSTNAASDESRSRVHLTWMQCHGCGYHQICDEWEIGFDWNVDIMLPDDETRLPPLVEPLRDRD